MILFFHFILCVSPVFSTGKLSSRGHPRLSNASDQEALLGFMSAITDYDGSLSLPTVWKPNVSFCEWAGIVCSPRRQRVVSLNVSSTGLQGTVSPRLGNLSFLTLLDLSNNGFHGHIPYQLGNLFRLEILYLDFNKLQGSIPPTLGGCRRLRFFSSSENNLTGNIPSELCILPKLQFFNLKRNNLTGTIPHCLGNISSLDVLALYFVREQLSWQSSLRIGFLSNCTNLQKLDISGNQLSGHIPAELCRKNTWLTIFYLESNLLNGTIPDSLFNCTNLRKIDLGDNQLSGVMSTKFCKLTHLQRLSLGDNKLVSGSTTSCPILSALTNCSSLRQILLYSNHLTGRLPPCMGQLSTSMDALILEFDELTGEIPPEIGNLTSLILLALDNNKFTGVIPSSLTMLQRLERLYLDSNFLEGNIPIKIGQLKILGYINLFGNNLWGRIPDFIAGNQQLRYLNLAHNMLSGKIPAHIGNCVNLLTLDLSYNKLSGHIPQEVACLANLAFYFNISNNLLDGLVPTELSKMTMLQAIDISANQFTGNISSALGNCKELEYLNLSYNALQGLIPVSLGELQNLQVMDFSNNFSGGIPMSLANLKMLNHLNFSFNKLSGEVPKGGVFKKIGATAFMGNPRLCGPWAGLSPCSSHKHKSVWHMKRVILPVVAVVIVVVLCLFLGIFWILNCKRHIFREVGTSLNVEHPRISYGEIITATNEFDDANLLGVGNFGKVYKGVLNNGTSVAVKLLNLENEGAYKSFDRECKVLGKVRHRNLIRIITTYSDLQTKALIFPLMPNGSLEKWLYPNSEEESCLSLIQRLNIAIDIAQGMAYLHHHCFM
eukprot:PITA_22106